MEVCDVALRYAHLSLMIYKHYQTENMHYFYENQKQINLVRVS